MRPLLFCLTLVLLSPAMAWAQEATKGQTTAGPALPGPATKLLPDISLVGSLAGGFFRHDPAGDQGENPSRTGFNFQGMELALQSVVDPYARADVFIHFAEHEVEVEEAVLTTLALPSNFQIRAGKLLVKLGRENTQHLEQLSFIDASQTNRHFLGQDGLAELGVEVSYLLPASWFSEVSVEVLQGTNPTDFNSQRKQDLAYLGHWKNFFDLTDDLGLQTGFSHIFGFNNTARGHWTQISGADLYLRWKPSTRRGLKWQSEYFLRRRQEILSTTKEGGFYTQVVGQFARRWELGLRYDRIGVPKETVSEQALTPALTFLATEFFHLRAQYAWVSTSNTADNHEAFLQAQFNIGPHGAHQF